MGEGVRLYAGTQHGLFVWRSRNGGWEPVFSGFESSVFDSIAGSKQRPERVFTTVAFDGLYRTTDGGKNWSRVLAKPDVPEGDVRAVAVDPTDDRVVYAGTEPVHLFRSEDGGDTWEELAALPAMPEEVRQKWWTPYPPHTGHVRNVFIHPDDPRILYVCLEHGGVVRSFDRGATWEDVSDGIDYVDMHLLANLPGSKERYYVTSARGFFTSEDPARGWVRAEEGMTRNYFHDFLFLPPARAGAAPQMLISAGDGSPGVWRRESQSARAALFRSDDCGESWYRVGHNLPEDMPAFMWALTPHPTDPGAVFGGVGAVNRGQAEDTPSNGSVALDDAPGDVLLSRDRGDTWERLPLTLPADRVLWAAADE
jgi:photosystem II stability/assembly factor-like uncharacterized protein